MESNMSQHGCTKPTVFIGNSTRGRSWSIWLLITIAIAAIGGVAFFKAKAVNTQNQIVKTLNKPQGTHQQSVQPAKSNPLDPETIMSNAVEARQMERIDIAIYEYRRVAKNWPEDELAVEASFCIAECLFELSQPDSAAQEIDMFLKWAPVGQWRTLAVFMKAKCCLQSALNRFQDEILGEIDDADLHMQKAADAYVDGKIKMALNELIAAKAVWPDGPILPVEERRTARERSVDPLIRKLQNGDEITPSIIKIDSSLSRLVVLADFYAACNANDEALALYSACNATSLEINDSVLMKAQLAAPSFDRFSDFQMLRRLIKIVNDHSCNTPIHDCRQCAYARWRQGRELARRGDYSKALGCFAEFLAQYGNDNLALNALYQCSKIAHTIGPSGETLSTELSDYIGREFPGTEEAENAVFLTAMRISLQRPADAIAKIETECKNHPSRRMKSFLAQIHESIAERDQIIKKLTRGGTRQ